jgi:hypothetical protein
MTTIDLLTALEESFPTSREIKIDGFEHPLWLWKIELPELMELMDLPRETQGEQLQLGIESCVKGVCDESGAKIFESDRGRKWLATHPMAAANLAKAVYEFNEIDGPSDDRKKKSNSRASSNASSNSVEDWELDTLDD